MQENFSAVWLGRGGQGAFTAARLLGQSAMRTLGLHAMAYPSFGPERRGAPVLAYTRISNTLIHDRSSVEHADALIVLDQTLLGQVPTPFLHERTLLIVDAKAPVIQHANSFHIDASIMARELLGSHHTNTILLGYLAGISGLLSPEAIEDGLTTEFGAGVKAKNNIKASLQAFLLGSKIRQNETRGLR